MMRSDARKRTQPPMDLLVEAKALTLEDVAAKLTAAIDTHPSLDGLDTHDAGYVDGWNAAARYFAAHLTEVAAQVRAAQS